MKAVKNVWIGTEESWFVLYTDGSSEWNNLPKILTKLLRKSASDPTILAFSGDCYYVQFPDHSYWSVEDTELSDYFNDYEIEQVEFGSNGCESYFVKFSDGSTAWNSLPRDLHNKINGRQKSLPGVSCLTFAEYGYDSAYFIMFQNRSYSWYSDDDCFDEAMEDASNHNGIDFVRLAPDDSSIYYVKYGDGTSAWNVSDDFSRAASSTKHIKTSQIRYTQDSISKYFQDGRSVKKLVKHLKNESVSVYDIPYIECFVDENGIWWSNDNRRLWAFKEAGLEEVPVIKVDHIADGLVCDNGRFVKIRG
ncbi:hypothetical protein HK096_009413, partial [Nowakowskiella sp. JEL0078]